MPYGTMVLAAMVVVLTAATWATLMGFAPRRLQAFCLSGLLFAGLILCMDVLGLHPAWLYGALLATPFSLGFWLLSRQRRVLPGRAGFVSCSTPTDIFRHLPSFIVGREGKVRDIHVALTRFVGGGGSADREGPAPHLHLEREDGGALSPLSIPDDRWLRAVVGRYAHRRTALLRAIPLGGGENRVVCAIPPTMHEDEQSPSTQEGFFSFTAAVHDLRTPAATLVGYAEMLLDKGRELDEESQEALQAVLRNGHYLVDLVDLLLEEGRQSAGPPPARPTDAAALLREQVEDLSYPVRKAGGELVLEEGKLPPLVDLSGITLRRVLTNLIDNAIKHGGGAGIRVRSRWTQRSGGVLTVEVSDSGLGIPENLLTEVFSPYVQLDGKGEGTPGVGLGLTIVRQLVNDLGGQIQVDSSPEKGTTFTVTLPAPASAHTANPLSNNT